jgi:hypothetical protein
VAALVLAYLLTILGRGHGIFPAGLLLVPGLDWDDPPAATAVVAGWLGIAAALVSLIGRLDRAGWVAAAGVVLLTASLTGLAAWTGAGEIMLITGIPFFCAAAWLIVRVFNSTPAM